MIQKVVAFFISDDISDFHFVLCFNLGKKEQRICVYKTSWVFSSVLRYYGLTESGYRELVKIDSCSFVKILNKKPVTIYVDSLQVVSLEGPFKGEIIQYINSNEPSISGVLYSEGSIVISGNNYDIRFNSYSDIVSVYRDYSDRSIIWTLSVDKLPLILDLDKSLDDSTGESYLYSEMESFNFSIYDLFRFKSKMNNFADILYRISAVLGVQDFSLIKTDYKNIIINSPISLIFNNLKNRKLIDSIDFFDYFYSNRYKSFRSSYTKIINI